MEKQKRSEYVNVENKECLRYYLADQTTQDNVFNRLIELKKESANTIITTLAEEFSVFVAPSVVDGLLSDIC